MERIKNISRTIVSNFWATLEHVNFNYVFRNGEIKNLTHESFGKSDGIAVLLFNPSTQNIILTKQLRIPLYIAGVENGSSIEVVGGAMDINETPEQACIRETKEEVGYKVSNIKKVVSVFLSPGLLKERVHLFIAEYTESDKVLKGGGVSNEGEEIEILEYHFTELKKMIDNNFITDARTILLFQYLQLKLK